MEMGSGTGRVNQGVGGNTALGHGRAAGNRAGKETAAAAKAATEFESLFIEMMLKSMHETVGTNSLTGGGRGEDLYRSLLDREYSRAMAEHGGIGLAAMLKDQLSDRHGGQGTDSHDKKEPNTNIEVNHEDR